MSRSFNLTAELNLRGPSNIRPIIAGIRRQLSGITADVNINVNNNTTRNVNNLQQSINRLNTALNASQGAARNAANALTAFGRAAAAANNNLGNIPRNLNRINANANNTNNTLNQVNRTIGQTATGFEEFGRQSALAVRRFAAFATVTGVIFKFSGALSAATRDFIDFNRELVRVAQVTDSSLSELTPLVNQITKLSTSLGVASKDLIIVSSTLAQAGLTARDTEKALKALALSSLAPSFDNLTDTVEGSSALTRQFGISASELEGALGSVNAVAAKFAVEAGDLITAIQRTGGVFATASKGVSEGKDALNEFLAVFTSIRQTTRESAETIATGLRTIFTRIQRGDTIDALKQYGVVLTDLTGKFVGPFEATRRLSEGLSKLDPRDLKFSKIVEELGGFRQIGKVIPLIQQFAVAQQALKVAQQGQGSLAIDASTAQLSLANQISKVREEFTALIRSLGESATFQTFVRLSLDLASALIRLADSAKTVLPALTAIAAFKGISALTRFGAGFAGGLRRQNNGGQVRGFASGGLVPGTGNSDTVPAMLTAGEFVIRKKAVERIGSGNLHKMNRYAGGGFAEAPLVDDIKANARGAMLPSKIALEKIIQTGYGALDFDRTLKRTTGDAAYGKAKTPQQKDAVLSKYFKDPSTRLADAKSSRLTQFGRMLIQSIKEGKVDPKKLSIISKSGRTPGLAEHINELFGIPVANMAFTSGNDKGPALDALRAKGPRANRVSRFAFGGGVTRDPKNTLQNFFEGNSLYSSNRKETAGKIRDMRSLRSAAPQLLYSSISRNAFDLMAAQTGLNKNPKIPEGTKLFDREKYYDQEAKKIIGRTFKLTGFLSTSKEFNKAKMFLDNADRSEDNWAAMMTIMTKKKAMGVDVEKQLSGRKVGGSKQTLNPRTGKMETFYQKPPESESEFTLQPGSRFKVNSSKFVDMMSRKNLWMDVQQFKDGGEAKIPKRTIRGLFSDQDVAAAAQRKGMSFAQLKAELEARNDTGFKDYKIPDWEIKKKYGLVPSPFDVGAYSGAAAARDKEKTAAFHNRKRFGNGGYGVKLKIPPAMTVDEAIRENKYTRAQLSQKFTKEVIEEKLGPASAKKVLLNNSEPMSKEQQAGIPMGLVGLYGNNIPGVPKITPKGNKVTVWGGTLDKSISEEYEQDIVDGFKKSIENVGGRMAQQIGAVPQSGAVINKIMKDSGIDSVVGATLEGSIGVAGNPYTSKDIAAIDFNNGLNSGLAKLFNIPPSIPTDATRTVGDSGKKGERGKSIPKFLGQVDRFLLAENPNIIPSVNMKKRKKTIKRALGGGVPGQDSVPALLTPGEFVINKKAASTIGAGRLHQLNRADRIQGFNKGGAVGHVQKLNNGGFLDPQLDTQARQLALELKKGGMDLKEALTEARKRIRESMQGPVVASGGQTKNTTNFSPVSNGLSDSQRRVSVTRSSEDIQQARLARRAASRGDVDLGFDFETTPDGRRKMRGNRRTSASGADTTKTSDMMVSGGSLAEQATDRYGLVRRGGDAKTADQYNNILQQQSQSSNVVASSSRRAQNYGNLATQSSQKSYAASSFDPTQIYQGLAKLNQGIATAANSLTTLTTASKAAGGGIMSLGKGALGAVGRGAGGLVSKIGGGALGMMGLGGLSSRGAGGAGGAGGGGGGMAGIALSMFGGVAIDAASKSLGGEKTESGRNVAAVGGSVMNMAAIGATIGSIIPGVGTALGGVVGAAAGLVIGLGDAKKANEEYAQSQRQATVEKTSEKSGKALESYLAKPTGANKQNFFNSFAANSAAETDSMSGVKQQKASSFGKLLGYEDENVMDLSKRKAKTQTAGAQQAEQFLTQEMMRTGKSFSEVSKTMNPAQFKTLTANIAEADETYVAFQTQRANEIKKLRDSGRGAEADALQDRTNAEQQGMADNLARRKLAEVSAAAQAKAAAEASKKLHMVMMQAVVSLEKSFDTLDQTLNRSSFDLDQISGKANEILTGKASLTSNNLDKTNNILKNPSAYSATERENAISSSASRMGSTGQLVGRMATFGASASEEATRVGNQSLSTGGGNDQIGSSVTRSLTNNILSTFGADSAMAQTLIAGVNDTVSKAVEEANANGTTLDPSELVDKAAGPLNKASQQAAQLLIKTNENVAKHLEELGKVAEMVVQIEQKRVERTAALTEMQAQGRLATKEALGQKVSLDEKNNARFAGSRARLGIRDQKDFTPQNIANIRSQAQQEQQRLQSRIETRSKDVGADPRAAREVANLQLKLAKVNQTIETTTKELEDLPQALEGAISDVTSEIQKRVSQLEARTEAGGAFAEKLVGSTPQELMELNRTYSLLNNTLRGQLTTVQQSQVAQQAYFEALQQGKTAQEAMTDAQSAFANENKKALSLFGELTQIAGIEGPDLNLMKADLLEGFARSQGTGLDTNPFFQKILGMLRQNPQDRAKNDPVLIALTGRLQELNAQQVEAVKQQNAADSIIQKDLLKNVGDSIIQNLDKVQKQFVAAMNDIAMRMGAPAPKANGGLIYASGGKYVNFAPKGTDTVPAMLTPGEFVINAKSTKENLGLLTAINNSRGGKINYLASGGQPDLSGVSSRSQSARQEDIGRAALTNQTSLRNKLDNVSSLSRNINSTTSFTKNNQIPSIDSTLDDNQTSSSKQFNSLGTSIKNLSDNIKSNTKGLKTGGIVYAADGTLVNFQPKGTDTVPAMLTPGEFVVNARSTKNNLGLLEQINSGYYARGGDVPVGAPRNQNELMKRIVNVGQQRLSKFQGQYAIRAKDGSGLTQQGKAWNRGDVEAFVEGARSIPEAYQLAYDKYDWAFAMRANIKPVSLMAEKTGQYKKLSPGEKLIAELQQQMKEAPQLFGKDAFNQLPEDAKKYEILQKIKDGQNPGELYRKATKRENYLKRVANNTKLALRFFGSDAENTLDRMPDMDKIKDMEQLKGVHDLVTQYDGATKELNLIPRVWNAIMSGQQYDEATNMWIQNPKAAITGLQKDNTTVFNELDPSSLPDKSYFNRGGVVYAQNGIEVPSTNYVPFKTPKLKASNDRRMQGERVQEEKQKAAMLDRLRKQLNTQLSPTGNRAMFELQERLRASGYLEGKSQRKDAVIDDEEYEQIRFALDMIDEYKRFQYSQIPVNNKFNTEAEKTRRRNNPQLPPPLPHLTPQSKQYGGAVYANKGTLVPYQPKGTDTVPAMLTPGEFVVNRQSSQKHLGLLQSINNGNYAKGGPVYLSGGTPGTEALASNMTYLSDILKTGADRLNTAFISAIKKLNNITDNTPEIKQGQTNGVSTNQTNPLASIEALGNRLDQFIEQLKSAIPSKVILEVPTAIPVNVTINGASILQNVLGGPIGNIVQQAIKEAFDNKSRQNEGY